MLNQPQKDVQTTNKKWIVPTIIGVIVLLILGIVLIALFASGTFSSSSHQNPHQNTSQSKFIDKLSNLDYSQTFDTSAKVILLPKNEALVIDVRDSSLPRHKKIQILHMTLFHRKLPTYTQSDVLTVQKKVDEFKKNKNIVS